MDSVNALIFGFLCMLAGFFIGIWYQQSRKKKRSRKNTSTTAEQPTPQTSKRVTFIDETTDESEAIEKISDKFKRYKSDVDRIISYLTVYNRINYMDELPGFYPLPNTYYKELPDGTFEVFELDWRVYSPSKKITYGYYNKYGSVINYKDVIFNDPFSEEMFNEIIMLSKLPSGKASVWFRQKLQRCLHSLDLIGSPIQHSDEIVNGDVIDGVSSRAVITHDRSSL